MQMLCTTYHKLHSPFNMAQYLSHLADDRLHTYNAQFSTYATRHKPMQVQHADDSKYALVTHVLHDVF